MNPIALRFAHRLQQLYNGDPWFGRNAESLLADVPADAAFQKHDDEHSILELLWHMINWKEFIISRLKGSGGDPVEKFEREDWRILDHQNPGLWSEGLERYHSSNEELIRMVKEFDDSRLNDQVSDRNYSFETLLNGAVEHDVYHLGQIAYLTKKFTQKW